MGKGLKGKSLPMIRILQEQCLPPPEMNTGGGCQVEIKCYIFQWNNGLMPQAEREVGGTKKIRIMQCAIADRQSDALICGSVKMDRAGFEIQCPVNLD